MICQNSAQVQRYYDGELPPASRASLEAHLTTCADCRALLAELQELNTLVQSAPMVDAPSGAPDRWIRAWRASRDRGVLRLAEWFTAAAAAVLIGAVLSWPTDHNEATASALPVLETVAVTPPSEIHEDANRETVVVAQWMADDLSYARESAVK